jgi:hypothetical protein
MGVLGLIALIVGCSLVFTRMQNLSLAEAHMALANLAGVNLDRISAEDSLVITLVIPDTPQWVRIRRRWGEPDFLIVAVSPGKSLYCLSKFPVTIAVMDAGEQIPTEPAGPPYAYSSDCSTSTRKFNAAPGSRLTISVVKNGTALLPPGELIIVGSWWNTKDKLVGILLDQYFRNISTAAIVCGLVLISLAGWLTWRSP